MNYQKLISKLESQIAKVRSKQAKQEGKQFLAVAKEYGHKTIDSFIHALSPYASPVLKSKLGAKKAKSAAAPKQNVPAKKKRTRATIDDQKREAIIADLKTGKLTGAETAKKHGVSVPSIANIKKAAGLTKKK
jgi:hypothetical protein